MENLNLNPMASGNKTVTGIAALASGGWTAAALVMLPQFGIESKTVEIGIALAPGAIQFIVGIAHKIVKAGGIKKAMKDTWKKYWG
jgi:hypothetical protein